MLSARVLSLPPGDGPGGELGGLMGGAQTALVVGSEAMWSNPAGLAGERGRQLTVGGLILQYQKTGLGAETRERMEIGPGHFAYAEGLSKGHRFPRFSYGLSVRQRHEDGLAAVIGDQRLGSAASLPFGVGAKANIDTDFPGGIQVGESANSAAGVAVLSSSLGLGAALGKGFRLGVALRLERVRASLQNTSALSLEGSAGADTLTGQSLTAWSIEGESERMVITVGMQIEVSSAFSLGATLKLPSNSLGGNGWVKLNHNDRIVTTIGGVGSNYADAVTIDESGLSFELKSPRVFQIGFAFKSDWITVVFDVALIRAQGEYPVLPGVGSRTPSTTAGRLPPLTTSGTDAMRMAMGMGFYVSTHTSWVMGLLLEESPVPYNDPLFRKVDLTTYSGGIFHERGKFSVAIGLRFQQAEQTTAIFPALEGGDAIQRQVLVSRLGVHAGGSLRF